MAKKETNRKPLTGNRRSHSCHAEKHTQKLNMVTVTDKDGKKSRISAREYRTMKKAA